MNYEFKKIRTTDFSLIRFVKIQPRPLTGRLTPYLPPQGRIPEMCLIDIN